VQENLRARLRVYSNPSATVVYRRIEYRYEEVYYMPRATRTETKTTGTATRTIRATRADAERYLAKVPEGNVFWSHDGRVLRDMKDLKDALADMSDHVFSYHLNEMRNDFSNWVKDVIGDQKLARDLEKASNREQAAKMVDERYSLLSGKLS